MGTIKKILMIEDDRFIVELYAHALAKAGYDVQSVISGPEGLEEAKKGTYDLVLLDIMIPDMTGIEVLEELRGKDGSGLPETKIVIATNIDQDDSSRAAVEQKADGYLIKADVTPRKLIEIIEQLDEHGEIGDTTTAG